MPVYKGRKVLTVIMDGVGARSERFGNAVAMARHPHLDWLQKNAVYGTLRAHGTSVGLPSDADMGNSEVGHNAIGAGRVFDQGAKLVQNAIDTGTMFEGICWKNAVKQTISNRSSLHFIGLLSDGNVHSHEKHLHAMLRRAKGDGVRRVRIHPLLDGRDVGEKSAEIYIERLETVLAALSSSDFDIKVASGGGRMVVTMDRYEADWSIVERGWRAHVLGVGPRFPSLRDALKYFRTDPSLTDQNISEFVIAENDKPVGTIEEGDAVICFNFRGDRAIEISRAFTEDNFKKFDRVRAPRVFYAGMMQYDGDLKIPAHFLVDPPLITNTLTDNLIRGGIRQFACSETQKYGHVTYFWNGNRSGKVDEKMEQWVEIPSDDGITFDLKPWMKAYEITQTTIFSLRNGAFDFARINYANGDMVGHTGDLEASIIAVATVDQMIGRLKTACDQTETILMVTADHGNCDEMFDAKPAEFLDWENTQSKRPKPKTSHTLSPVPFYFYDPKNPSGWRLDSSVVKGSIAHIAGTVLTAMEQPVPSDYLPSLVKRA